MTVLKWATDLGRKILLSDIEVHCGREADATVILVKLRPALPPRRSTL